MQAQAQDSTLLKGTLTDSAGNPLSGAMITLVKLSTGAGAAFSRTDNNGQFKFKITENLRKESLAVKAALAGYILQQQKVQSIATPLQMTMKAEVHQLEEVVIKSKVYIVQKSDTISFNADFFRDSSDRVLGDLIRKIPGITVDDNGTIKYNGQTLNNFYIEGDDLLDGKYNLATDNIPSKDVEKVEVIEHNQHIKMLNGIVQSNQPALNIRLKDHSKLRWINNAELAGGTPSRYNVKLNTMAFKPKFKAINAISANNNGEDLNYELYSHYSNNSAADPMINIGMSRPAGISQKRYLFNKNQMLNVNDMLHLHNGSTVRLNAFLLHDEQPFSMERKTTYYLPNQDTVAYSESSRSQMQINHAQATFTLNNNTEKKYFNESFFSDISTTKNPIAIFTNGTAVQENLRTTLNSFSNNLNGVLLLGKSQKILSYNSTINYSRNPQRFQVAPGWLPDILNDSINYLQSSQFSNLPAWNIDNDVSMIIKKGYWTFTNQLGVNYNHSTLHSNIEILQNDQKWTTPSDVTNHLIWNKTDGYFLPTIQFEKDRSRINVNLPLHYYNINYKDNTAQVADRLNKFYLQPSITYNLKVAKEHELNASYRYSNSFSDVQQVYGAGMMQNYRSLQSYYKTPLLSGYQNSYSLRFAYKKTLKMFFWNVGANYANVHRYFMYGSDITNTSYQINTLPIQNKSQNLSVGGDISKYLFALKTNVSISAGISQSKMPQYQNGYLFSISNWSNNYGIKLSPRPTDWLRIDLDANYLTNTSSSSSEGFLDQKTSQFSQKSALNFIFFQRLTAQFSSEYYGSYLNGQQLAKCFFLDAYFNYRLYKPSVDLRISCTNLANEKNFTILNASSNVISTTNYNLQPRTFLLSAAFHF